MKLGLTLVLLVLCLLTQAQFSVSGGINQNFENVFKNGDGFFVGNQTLHRYNGFALQGDLVRSKFRTYGEIGFFSPSFEITRTESEISRGGGSSPYFSNTDQYHISFDFSYVTFKLGMGREFKTMKQGKLWASFSCNLFAQYDRLIHAEDSHQILYRTSVNETAPGVNTTTVQPADESVGLINHERNIIQFGSEIKGRVAWENCFLELSSSLGITDKYRLEAVSASPLYNEQSSSWNFSVGLKLGHVFGRKTQQDPVLQ